MSTLDLDEIKKRHAEAEAWWVAGVGISRSLADIPALVEALERADRALAYYEAEAIKRGLPIYVEWDPTLPPEEQ